MKTEAVFKMSTWREIEFGFQLFVLQVNRPESIRSTQERCLLVALVQTIYTTYGNDSIHFGAGTREVLVLCRLLAGSTTHPLLNRKTYGCSYLVNSYRVAEVCGVCHHPVNRVKHISFVENHVLSCLHCSAQSPKAGQPDRALT